MKMYEAKYGFKYASYKDFRPWGEQLFLLEDTDEPVELIKKHYESISNELGQYT